MREHSMSRWSPAMVGEVFYMAYVLAMACVLALCVYDSQYVKASDVGVEVVRRPRPFAVHGTLTSSATWDQNLMTDSMGRDKLDNEAAN